MTKTYSMIYTFGDSLSDAGNAYLVTNSSIASYLGFAAEPVSPPYAQISYGSVTADVFSNGPVWTQDLAQALGLGTLAPSGVGATALALIAALTPQLGVTGAQIETAALEILANVTGINPYIPLISGVSGGTDFAIGGAITGITSENTDPANGVTDLAAQLATFQHDVPTPAATALATVSIGANDVLNLVDDSQFSTLFATGTTLADVGATQAGRDIAQSVSIEAGFLGSLISQGVDNILVLNVPDVGKTPEAMDLGPTIAADATILAEYYNNLLGTDVVALNTGSVDITIANSFSLIDNAVANPAAYGLQDVTSPVYSGTFTSYAPGELVSSNPAVQDTYLFFDHLHPTATGELALAQTAETALGVACFAAGTRIATAVGEIAVEDLAAGNSVALAAGGMSSLVWIGHRRIDCKRHPHPQDVWPVRVRAHAFGAGLPRRDLRLSPDHAVFIYDVLIPIRLLVNGTTLTQETVDEITYYHIELPEHGVVLAENLPAESYLDLGNRGAFDNGGGALVLHPDFASRIWERDACAELILGGPTLTAVQQRLKLQAELLGRAARQAYAT
jgi:phospholipase/lecithinase/hemolysin